MPAAGFIRASIYHFRNTPDAQVTRSQRHSRGIQLCQNVCSSYRFNGHRLWIAEMAISQYNFPSSWILPSRDTSAHQTYPEQVSTSVHTTGIFAPRSHEPHTDLRDSSAEGSISGV